MRKYPFTLIEIMVGVYNLRICNMVKGSDFRFLIGLIMKANELRFPEELSLTNDQAMDIGGGKSRQHVNQLRKSLSEVRVGGEPLLNVTPGDAWAERCAIYRINYDVLLKNSPVWQYKSVNSYQDYLQTKHWKSIRKAALRKARYRCQVCNSNKRLNVHHRTYENLGHEEECDVIVLCQECHEKFHEKE